MSDSRETAEEFEIRYATRSGMTIVEFRAHQAVVPCDCDYDKCTGWQAIGKAYAAEAGICVNCGRAKVLHLSECPEYKPYEFADAWEALTTEQRGDYLKRAADPSITNDAAFEIAKRMARDDAAKKGHP